ncbi:NADPH:quinone reductase-like Zn-dependent oxidoreductase [Pontibacter ummariensis]|uniref:NADPH:quinone reductase n=1 Tax=Pontibacter ummariensis TaxID=1610492 RepID=A0A239ESR6_9BACT|nr:NADP-dependent oxidoreductase [Pontibacter ummariensis]PRY12791.1 NADPH:quinone reductase-like Zn-dependent oxidoreductase [Pontibacter ummariensis]SNS47063.1 NADPH:quinone reductase [Pontibacter ummariensis]
MKAFVLNEPGPAENLQLQEIEKPTPKKGEVLVKVRAVSVNPVDTKVRAGKGLYNQMKETPPVIVGWDISGDVVAVGEGVEYFKEGDEVFGMVNFPGHGKAYAEYVAAPENHLAHKPANVPHHEAAAATLAALTAWQVLVHQADIQPGQRVLIHAAAGGVGHYAVQIAKYFKAIVIGTASEENHEFLRTMGADEQIDYHKYNPADVVMDADIVLDSLGEENTRKSLAALKDGGKIISILGGATEAVQEEAKKRNIKAKSYLVHSSGEDQAKLADLLRDGKLRSHVSHAYDFEDMAKAHQQVETRKTNGKVVVTVGS